MKEALDWTAIQAGYESGHSIASLDRDHDVSTSAIHKRAKCWSRPNGSTRGRSRDRAETLAKLLERGFSERTAAHVVGLTLNELADWKDDNPLLARRLGAVTAQGITDHLEGHRLHGDWRAPQWNPAEQEPITVVLNVPRPEPYVSVRET